MVGGGRRGEVGTGVRGSETLVGGRDGNLGHPWRQVHVSEVDDPGQAIGACRIDYQVGWVAVAVDGL